MAEEREPAILTCHILLESASERLEVYSIGRMLPSLKDDMLVCEIAAPRHVY